MHHRRVDAGWSDAVYLLVLPPLLSAFSERYPGVELRLHEAPTARLKEQLQEGMLDFAVDNSAFDPAVYEVRLFKREQVILSVPRDFEVNEAAARFRLTARELSDAQRPRASLALFRDLPFLMLKEGNDTRERAEYLCAQAGFSPRIRLQLCGLPACRLWARCSLYQRYAGSKRAAGRTDVFLPHRQPGRGTKHPSFLQAHTRIQRTHARFSENVARVRGQVSAFSRDPRTDE